MQGFLLATQIVAAFFTGLGVVWVLLNVARLVVWPADRPRPKFAKESLPSAFPPRPDYPKIRAMEQDLYGEWFTVDGLAESERLRPHRARRAFEVERESEGWLR